MAQKKLCEIFIAFLILKMAMFWWLIGTILSGLLAPMTLGFSLLLLLQKGNPVHDFPTIVWSGKIIHRVLFLYSGSMLKTIMPISQFSCFGLIGCEI